MRARQPKHAPTSRQPWTKLTQPYLQSALKGDAQAVSSLVDQALKRGAPISEIYLRIIAPAQKQLGELWKRNKISITQEHIATQLSLDQMRSLRARITPAQPRKLRALLCTSAAEPHELGARMVADFFLMDGWEVYYPGPLTPTADLVEFARAKQVHLVGISVSLESSIPTLRELVNQLKSLKPTPRILVGGPAASRCLERLEIDAVALSPTQAVLVGTELCNPVNESLSTLSTVLKELGARISTARKARSMSQTEFADLCQLDRAYLSALENGRKNVSLGTLHRIASLVGMEITDLLATKTSVTASSA